MSVEGSLRKSPIQDVLSRIERRGAAGTLTVELGQTVRRFAIADGNATGSSSNLPGEQLGALLMSRGLVTEGQLVAAFQAQEETGVMLGKVLLMTGALDESTLRDVLEMKVREALCDVLSWDAGRFAFAKGAPRASEVEVAVPLATSIALGLRQAHRWRRIRALFPCDDATFSICDHFAALDPAASAQARAQTTRLIDCVERGLSLRQMILEHHGRRQQVMTRLGELVERGALALGKPPAGARPRRDAADLKAEAERRADEGDRAGALALAAQALAREPERDDLRALHARLERSLFAELSRELLGRFRVPRLLVGPAELDELELPANERYLAGRIDGRWDLLSLMRISPLRDVEALLSFKRLADRGVISL